MFAASFVALVLDDGVWPSLLLLGLGGDVWALVLLLWSRGKSAGRDHNPDPLRASREPRADARTEGSGDARLSPLAAAPHVASRGIRGGRSAGEGGQAEGDGKSEVRDREPIGRQARQQGGRRRLTDAVRCSDRRPAATQRGPAYSASAVKARPLSATDRATDAITMIIATATGDPTATKRQ